MRLSWIWVIVRFKANIRISYLNYKKYNNPPDLPPNSPPKSEAAINFLVLSLKYIVIVIIYDI